jgi:hypothetical protein
MQQRLNFFPEAQGHGSFRPEASPQAWHATRWVLRCGGRFVCIPVLEGGTRHAQLAMEGRELAHGGGGSSHIHYRRNFS